jgi:hypothetical protein
LVDLVVVETVKGKEKGFQVSLVRVEVEVEV